jgi:hypothetical protein
MRFNVETGFTSRSDFIASVVFQHPVDLLYLLYTSTSVSMHLYLLLFFYLTIKVTN